MPNYRILRAAVWFFLAIGCCADCSKQSTDSRATLGTPKFRVSSADTSVIEVGIDALPERDAIVLQWYKDDQFVRYQVYRRAENEGAFRLISDLPARDSLYIDGFEISLNKRYYYYLLGHDDRDRISQPSDTASYMLLPKAINLAQTTMEPLQFHWQIQQAIPQYYILKLFDDAADRKIWFSLVEPFQGETVQVNYNWDGVAVLAKLNSGVRYRWRVDIAGTARNSGSESAWQRFTAP